MTLMSGPTTQTFINLDIAQVAVGRLSDWAIPALDNEISIVGRCDQNFISYNIFHPESFNVQMFNFQS